MCDSFANTSAPIEVAYQRSPDLPTIPGHALDVAVTPESESQLWNYPAAFAFDRSVKTMTPSAWAWITDAVLYLRGTSRRTDWLPHEVHVPYFLWNEVPDPMAFLRTDGWGDCEDGNVWKVALAQFLLHKCNPTPMVLENAWPFFIAVTRYVLEHEAVWMAPLETMTFRSTAAQEADARAWLVEVLGKTQRRLAIADPALRGQVQAALGRICGAPTGSSV